MSAYAVAAAISPIPTSIGRGMHRTGAGAEQAVETDAGDERGVAERVPAGVAPAGNGLGAVDMHAYRANRAEPGRSTATLY